MNVVSGSSTEDTLPQRRISQECIVIKNKDSSSPIFSFVYVSSHVIVATTATAATAVKFHPANLLPVSVYHKDKGKYES